MNTERVEAAAKELCDLLESIDERLLLALDSDPHPPSAISVSVGVLRAALAAADAARK